ncbi:MAG: hypothetical protein ACRD8Z_26190 [Nitrososphaeraceae archaeon]
MITTKDMGFVAGLLEGEGCFFFRNSPTIQIQMTDEDTIVKLRSIISTGSSVVVKKAKNPNHKTAFSLTIMGDLAIQWMMIIYPFLCRRRKEKIREIIKTWKEMPGYTISSPTNLAKARLVTTLAKHRGISIEEARKIIEASTSIS